MAKEYTVTEQELKDLLASVESDLKTILKSEQEVASAENLAKAEASKEASSSASSSSSSTASKEASLAKEETPAESSEGSSKSKEASSKSPEASSAKSHEGSAHAPAEGSPASAAMDPKTDSALEGDAAPAPDAAAMAPEAPAEAAPPQAEAPADEEVHADAPPMELHDFYAGLPDEELKEHYMCAKQALFDRMAAVHAADEPEAPAAPMAPEMGKSEESMEKSGPAPEMSGPASPKDHMYKTEEAPEFVSLKKKLAEQEVAINSLVEVLDKVVAQPIRKSIKGISEVELTEKPVTLSTSDIKKKLNEKAADFKLSKKDRELINEYCYGNVSVEKIQHLLKD